MRPYEMQTLVRHSTVNGVAVYYMVEDYELNKHIFIFFIFIFVATLVWDLTDKLSEIL